MGFSRVLALCGAAAVAYGYDPIAYYTPLSNVSSELGYDSFLADLGTAMGSGDTATALLAYETPNGALPSLREMSTQAAATMGSQATFLQFATEFSASDFAHRFTSAAIEGSGDFAGWDATSLKELATKGASYQNVWHHVVGLLGVGVARCAALNASEVAAAAASGASDAPPAAAAAGDAWDQAWAYFTGAREGVDGSGSGKGPYALGDKRCPQFGTCVAGTSLAANNERARSRWQAGRAALRAANCSAAADARDVIIGQMAVPILQGALREAYEVDPDGGAEDADGVVEIAEGWAFARAVLPLIAGCSGSAARVVRENMWLNADPIVKDGYGAVKAAIESTYACLGITCADVGAMQTCGADGASACWAACSDEGGATGGGGDDDEGLTSSALALILAMIGLLALILAFAKIAAVKQMQDKSQDANANGPTKPSDVLIDDA